MNNQIFSEVFWTFFLTSVIGCVLTIVRQAYKSKCKEVDVCCIKIIRDTENEEKIDEIEMAKRSSSKDEEKI